MKINLINEEFMQALLRRVETGHVKIRMTKGPHYTFRENGKEFGWLSRGHGLIQIGTKDYVPQTRDDATRFYDMVSVYLGTKVDI